MLLSSFILIWQLSVLFACCLGVGLAFRSLIPKQFSLLHKVLFCLLGGLFLVVLVAQNLVYLGLPVRISAWLLLATAVLQGWWCRRKFNAWGKALCGNSEIRMLGVVVLLTITLHGLAPIQQGLDGYYGKGYSDQLNYVLLAEFLREEPYNTSEEVIDLRPWLIRPVGFSEPAAQLGTNSGPGQEMVGLKKERIGQSIVTAEISAWSGTNGKEGYAATVIFFLTVLAICLYVFLRETGVALFLAGSGALLAGVLPAVTRLSLNGFLSQAAILFVFPFFASLLRAQEFSARSVTIFFSLALAFVLAVYSEIAVIGFCTFFLGVMFLRNDTFRTKRLMLMSAILLVALSNPFYLRNLIGFLGKQYYMAANGTFLDHLAPNVLTLHAWSELLFGAASSAPLALLFDSCTLFAAVFFLTGALLLSRRDKLVCGVVLLPGILVLLYLVVRTPISYYALAKITLTILPFAVGLIFVALSGAAADRQGRFVRVGKNSLGALIAAMAVGGSLRYYSEVLHNDGLLRFVRDAHFSSVCRELEEIKNKRVLIFETYPLLTPWLCYHARHNDVYFDGRFISDAAFPELDPFSKVPDLANVDFVVTRDRIVDLKAPSVSCLTLVDDTPGEDRKDGKALYRLGPPATFRFLALRTLSANLKMRLRPGSEATTGPVDYFLANGQGRVFQGELWSENVDVRRIKVPRGISILQLSVKSRDDTPETPFPALLKLDEVELCDINLDPGG